MFPLMRMARHYPMLLATVLVGIVAIGMRLLNVPWTPWLVSGFALIMALILFIDMVRDIIHGVWGVDLLAITAIVSTVLVGEFWASLVVCLMLTGGEALEDIAGARAKSQLTSLMQGRPTAAHVLKADGLVEDVSVECVLPGDQVLVKPGEVVPVDGTLLSHHATTEESSLTGEPLPVEREAGAEIPSGGVNGQNAILIEALRPASESQYQQIVRLVEQAQDSKAPMVRLADRIAVPFTVLAFVIAGIAWAVCGDPVRLAQVLVVATPCPLILAAPVAFLAGMNRAAKAGIIVKDSASLERLSTINTVALDKTGTLTVGHPQLVGINTALKPQKLLEYAAAVEAHSTHPLAQAVVAAAQEADVRMCAVTDVREQPGAGVIGTVEGHRIRVGNTQLIPDAPMPVQENPGHISVHVSIDDTWAGTLILADSIRPDATWTVSAFKDMGVKHVMMVTGDTLSTAQVVAHDLGIDHIHAQLKPADKVERVLQAQPRVMAIGDGVNDAPVLASADLGMAMGARGSSAASESADVVIMLDDIHLAAKAMAIGKRTMGVAKQSILIGVALSIVLMGIAATGIMPAVVGAMMQEVVDLSCILWALTAAWPGLREPHFEGVKYGDETPHSTLVILQEEPWRSYGSAEGISDVKADV